MQNPEPMLSTTIEGPWTYPNAVAVMQQLRSIGVECGESVGGVWLSFDLEQQGPAVVAIVKGAGGQFCRQTMMQALTLEGAERHKRSQDIAKLEALWNVD